MTKCSTSEKVFQEDLFSGVEGRKISVDFDGGSVSSDGGVLLLRQTDKKIGLLKRAAKILSRFDKRQEGKIEHDIYSMFVQRVYGIAMGYEDLNDHDELRHDIAWQTVADRTSVLASSPTLCRFEAMASRQVCMELSELLLDVFMESFKKNPRRLVLDFDNTDAKIHGNQEGKFFHGYYDSYCFLPIYVFCDQKLVSVFLQPSNEDGSKHAGALLKRIVSKLRSKWPHVKIIYRGDSGFARPRHLYWCEKNKVDYVIGFAKNSILEEMIRPSIEQAKALFDSTGEKAKLFSSFDYAAGSWNGIKRKVVAKAEYSAHGANPRFVLTTLEGDPQAIYNSEYCSRGDIENRIKEQQLGLFADRVSAHAWWTNQFRMQLSAIAYVIFEGMRSLALKGSEIANAQVSTIRLKLLKIGSVIRRNTKKIYFNLSSAFPYKNIFWQVAECFSSA